MNTNANKGFRICQNKGFHLTFKNRLTISVQFGAGNYCENYNDDDFIGKSPKQSNDAEIAVIDSKGNFITKEFGFSDDVEGRMNSDDVADLIYKVKNRK